MTPLVRTLDRLREKLGRLRRKLSRVSKDKDLPPDLTPPERDTLAAVRPFTMTSVERVVALIQAVEHVNRAKIPGAIVECGVWRGGSMMAVARTLLSSGVSDRELFLFDTFEGLSKPTESDRDYRGASAADLLERTPRNRGEIWGYASHEDVQCNMQSTGYPPQRVHFIKGRVEDTIPAQAPNEIAILRLDTDWYESTKHELTHLFPRLAEGGILIIDDSGHWQGARQATDDYFGGVDGEPGGGIFLHRIDYSGRLAVKAASPDGRATA
jgi:O-methyltransferase